MDNHLVEDPSTNDSEQQWKWEDESVFIFGKICNSIINEVICLINYIEFFKELIDYLDVLYFGKRNLSHIFRCVQSLLSIRSMFGLLGYILWTSKGHMRTLTCYYSIAQT